jgi:Icc-related predicted phosphoesterase
MKIVCISDTHGGHDRMLIPDGDILLHAGDMSKRGREAEIRDFNAWLGTLPHRHKVVIAGNHDFLFESDPIFAESLITNAVYLNDSEITVAGLRIWGSPITPWFYDWAFNRFRGADIRPHWDLIPIGIDILITHGPPVNILDNTISGKNVGCEDLSEAIARVRPRLHLFGHIHEAYGVAHQDQTQYINACMMDISYQPVNQAIVIELG